MALNPQILAHPKPQTVITFGNGILKDRISEGYQDEIILDLGCALNPQMTVSLSEDKEHGEGQKGTHMKETETEEQRAVTR